MAATTAASWAARARRAWATAGAVTKINPWGRQTRVAEGLASYANSPGFANGDRPARDHDHRRARGRHQRRADRARDEIPGEDISRDELAAEFPYADNFGRVLALRGHGRPPVSLGDIWAFERDNNPDGTVGNPAIDSNPVDVLFDGRRLVVADAGGNALDTVNLRGRVRNLTVFPSLAGVQAVPTSVVLGPDHNYYVSQLTGFPFNAGTANIFRVDPRTGEATVVRDRVHQPDGSRVRP